MGMVDSLPQARLKQIIRHSVTLAAPIDGRWILTPMLSWCIIPHRLSMGSKVMTAFNESLSLLPGTLDLLILRTLGGGGPMHGYGIAERLRTVSEDVLQVGESSLYPALQRLLLNGWVKAEWGASENNRRARFYSLTPAGRKQLVTEREEFRRIIVAIQKVLENA